MELIDSRPNVIDNFVILTIVLALFAELVEQVLVDEWRVHLVEYALEVVCHNVYLSSCEVPVITLTHVEL